MYNFFIAHYFVSDSDCEFLAISRPLLRDSEDHSSGAVVVYWCESFYSIVGGHSNYRVLECKPNGEWSSHLPQCEDSKY